ncbi:aspartic protease [Rhizoctonia solani AG-3 Rhs1AP]|uniref:Aspartic protease n=1 Tax=Rhizoctonia solani AG-3 Rhs1AP TaxID=1086054 RepID=A0A0A1UIH9_9AGAM|nr:aspartic protease [Rhizoctonia solani AG-3 Rhs1AP]
MYINSQSGSELYIGGINQDKYKGQITYLPQIDHMWSVAGSTSVDGEVKYAGPMIIDSGSSLILGPKESVWEWWGAIKGAKPCDIIDCIGTGYFSFPCNTPTSFHFTFNGQEFPITRKDLIWAKHPGQPLRCIGTVRVNDRIHNKWVLGIAFMKTVYTIFDMDNHQIGFAKTA